MWRTLFLSFIGLNLFGGLALAGPVLADDVTTCREKQSDARVRLDACEKLIASAQAEPKDLAVALAVRGENLLAKDFDKGIADFGDAIKADPENLRIVVARGWAYERKGRDDLAMADYNLALQKRPNYAAAYNNRGTLYLRKGALQSAFDDFTQAIKFAPTGFLVPYTNRARIETMNQDFDAALADFAKAEAIDPNAMQLHSNRCVTYGAMGRYDEALADCNALLARMPKYQYVLSNRADVYFAKGDLDGALKDYNTILEINPNNVRAHAGRGLLFERRRDLAQARADYRSAAFALAPYDDIEIAKARTMARERLAALTAEGPTAASGRRVALVIGNGGYRNAHPLENPPRDARLIAGVLKDLGFQSVTLANDLTRDKFFDTLHAFASEAEKADWAVVYYAGHGFEIGGVNYLVPVDAKLAVDKDAETEAVALEQVIGAVDGARGLRLVMLDACRDNPFAATMKHTIELKLVDRGFSNIEPSAGFMVVYAAKHGETALDGTGADSPFALAVARDLRESHVEVRKLFDIVRDDVWTSTRHAQQPFTYGSPPGREDFYFAGK
ncbi:MAG: caspase family protein [Bradyrhizobium sp.]|uniref:caspase family protein n=1 Tax=Bradyrhizobium sp. TaxID=376 RepID=UPI001D3B3B0C|nr:caspase family protein [Bradyrhizobium sp.]MBV9562148.1 caspase family protein [Bradyrhizobium sp.]